MEMTKKQDSFDIKELGDAENGHISMIALKTCIM